MCCSLNISTSLSRSLSVRVSFLSFTMCIMASRLFCESLFLEFVHMSFIRLKDLSTDCVDSKLFYYFKSKLINLLLFPSFPNSHHLCANFPNSKGLCPKYKWVGKSLDFKYIKTYIESSDMTITYEVSYRGHNLWFVSYCEEGVSIHQYLGKYKTKNKMQNCVECSYFLLDNRNRKEYECLECCLISEQMRFWAVITSFYKQK